MKLFTAGEFGTQVADRLKNLTDVSIHSLTQCRDVALLEELVKDAEFVGVAAFRPYVTEMKNIDELAFKHGFRWSSVEIHAHRVVFGPLVIPKAGACYHCYQRRWWTHHKTPDWENAVKGFYENHPEVGPFGHLGAMTELAAQSLLDHASAPESSAGHFRMMDVVSGSMLESEVIGIHECPRCRPVDENRKTGERFTKTLSEALEGVLS